MDRGIKDATGSARVGLPGRRRDATSRRSLGAITLAAREKLDNLIFVVNCNLQRLDGPVRGNGKIIQELEGVFRGAGWNVIKVIWGGDWDPLLGQGQARPAGASGWAKSSTASIRSTPSCPASYIREHFFGKYPELAADGRATVGRAAPASCAAAATIPEKVYAAYKAAVERQGKPTVILAKTIKGYGLGEAGEGRNVTHQQKKLNEEELREFRTPVRHSDFRRGRGAGPVLPAAGGQRGDAVPREAPRGAGRLRARALDAAAASQDAAHRRVTRSSFEGSGDREVSTTMAFVGCSARCSRTRTSAATSCPSCPTRRAPSAWKSLFRQCGIYAHAGQLYEPVDSDTVLYYREAKDGQILEEGITEAGSMSSFIAAGTAYATHGINMIPFFIYYSMFGFQRIGDLIWAAGDCRAKGFLLGGTAGRTTLAGEGLQHQDGHSHLLGRGLSHRPGLRSGLRLRDGRHRARRHAADVRGAGRRHLLHHAR